MRYLELINYQDSWPTEFDKTAKEIKVIFGDTASRIHHIGSTSIPGMMAKPTIDVLIEVQDISYVDALNTKMEVAGYIPRGENGIEGRRFFIKEEQQKRTHHVHVFQSGSDEINKHLAFRDYLIAFPNEAARYKQFKKDYIKGSSQDVAVYQQSKHNLVSELTENALKWRKSNE
ncbi:GrpB family protein [Marinilactibacillus kalidii]|uniref:GrpB family protein n=1 Tax=Marinilactibacillus kalidii TaxID=2820274 RepID=UPI001ABDC324|nr:GrpB family protein [Marinilactibacillus kalidii]